MPIYVVRWPREEAALIRARNERELMDILDEVADPGCVRWAVYDGPLWVSFGLRMKPWQGDGHDVEVDTEALVDGVATHGEMPLVVDRGEGETAWEMNQAISRWALPHLHAVVDAWASETPDAADRPQRPEAFWRGQVADALKSERESMDLLARERASEAARVADPKTLAIMQVLGTSIPPTWLDQPSALDEEEGD